MLLKHSYNPRFYEVSIVPHRGTLGLFVQLQHPADGLTSGDIYFFGINRLKGKLYVFSDLIALETEMIVPTFKTYFGAYPDMWTELLEGMEMPCHEYGTHGAMRILMDELQDEGCRFTYN